LSVMICLCVHDEKRKNRYFYACGGLPEKLSPALMIFAQSANRAVMVNMRNNR